MPSQSSAHYPASQQKACEEGPGPCVPQVWKGYLQREALSRAARTEMEFIGMVSIPAPALCTPPSTEDWGRWVWGDPGGRSPQSHCQATSLPAPPARALWEGSQPCGVGCRDGGSRASCPLAHDGAGRRGCREWAPQWHKASSQGPVGFLQPLGSACGGPVAMRTHPLHPRAFRGGTGAPTPL